MYTYFDDYRVLGLGDLVLKPGVFGSPSAAIQAAIQLAERVYAAFGLPLRVTSLQDGGHACCAHAEGRAVDFGTKDPGTGRQWTNAVKSQLAAALAAALGSAFRVLIESDHIHVQTASGAAVPTGSASAPVPKVPGLVAATPGGASSSMPMIAAGVLLVVFLLKR